VGISVSYPLPGTKFYEKVKEQLKEKQNWSDSDDLAMMFQSTFNSAYYKELHRYIHSVYQKNKGWGVLKKLLRSPLRLTYKDVRLGLRAIYFSAQSAILSAKLSNLRN